MLGIESKLYQMLTFAVEVAALHIICFVLVVPLFTLPVVIIIYCRFMSNIVTERKLFRFHRLTGSRILKLIGNIGVGYCAMYSILMLQTINDFFISRLIMAFVISFQVISGILILEYKISFMAGMRTAFFYSVTSFHKSVLPIFAFIHGLRLINGLLPVFAAVIIVCAASFFVFRMNSRALEKLEFLDMIF